MDRKIIASFPRNENERLVIAVGDYKKNRYIDIRVFYISKLDHELYPTKKGLTIDPALLPKLIDALTACNSKALSTL
jgi:hypothetical protein